MHHLILYQSTNKKFRKDSKYVFTPESEALEAFIKERGETVERYPINGNQWDKDAVKADLIDACLTTIDKKVDVFHCLCHGWKTGFQFGFKGRSGARLLGSLIGSLRPKYVNLYACLTGKGTDNFAKWLFEYSALYYERCNDEFPQIMCHSTKGHSTKNANVKLYFADSNGDLQSSMIYTRSHKLYWIWWYLLQTSNLRFEFPFLSKSQISAIVSQASEKHGIWSDMKKLRKKVLKF